MEDNKEDQELQNESNIQVPNSEQLNSLNLESPNPTRDFFAFIFDLAKTAIIVFVLAFIIRYFAIQPYIVEGQSMYPNYEDREYLIAEKLSYLFHDPQRGEVIIFRYPKKPSVNYIKRIIALPGETIKITENEVMIINQDNPNGIVLKENYLPSNYKTLIGGNKALELKLKENQFFVMGDNRENSSDSREWGILPKANIIGRSWISIAKIKENSMPSFYFKTHEKAEYDNLK